MADKTVILTKQEIEDAITNYIGIFKESMTFFPYRISEIEEGFDIPETVMFHLNYIPMGTEIRE